MLKLQAPDLGQRNRLPGDLNGTRQLQSLRNHRKDECSHIVPDRNSEAIAQEAWRQAHKTEADEKWWKMIRHDVWLMEAAVTLAEELNFSRAAEKLRITQSALTKRIAELESRISITLFDRGNQAVTLNDSGRAYVEEARLALLHSDRAINGARTALEQKDQVLRVGRSPYEDPFFSSVLQSIQMPLHPRLRMELISGFPQDLVQSVMTRRLDVALLTEPPELPAISGLKIGEDLLYAVLHEDDLLADRSEISFDDLRDREWVTFSRSVYPAVYQLLCTSLRGNARRVHEVLLPEEAYPLIVEHQHVALVTKYAALRIARDGAVLRPITDSEFSLRTYLIARSDENSRLVAEFLRSVTARLNSHAFTH